MQPLLANYLEVFIFSIFATTIFLVVRRHRSLSELLGKLLRELLHFLLQMNRTLPRPVGQLSELLGLTNWKVLRWHYLKTFWRTILVFPQPLGIDPLAFVLRGVWEELGFVELFKAEVLLRVFVGEWRM